MVVFSMCTTGVQVLEIKIKFPTFIITSYTDIMYGYKAKFLIGPSVEQWKRNYQITGLDLKQKI